jgi:hypothetical protein
LTACSIITSEYVFIFETTLQLGEIRWYLYQRTEGNSSFLKLAIFQNSEPLNQTYFFQRINEENERMRIRHNLMVQQQLEEAVKESKTVVVRPNRRLAYL